MSYYQFRDDDGNGYGSCEIFYMDVCTACDYGKVKLAAGEGPANYEPGFYWQPCFPGCLPDDDPIGPFETEEEAMADADVIS